MSAHATRQTQNQEFWHVWLSLLVAAVAFFAPSNLFYGFDQFDWAVRGLRIDYLLPKIYLTDLLLLALAIFGIVIGSFKKLKLQWFEKILTLFFAILLLRQFFTDFPAAAVTQFARIFLYGFTGFVVLKNWLHLRMQWVWFGLASGGLFQGILSLWQFFTQDSLGSYYTLFGEPNLHQSLGLAHGSFGSWGERVLPYGTTAHPNILAAWLVTSWLLLVAWSSRIELSKTRKTALLLLGGCLAIWSIFATQSITALGLVITGVIYLFVLQKYAHRSKIISGTFLTILTFFLVLSPWILQWSASVLPKTISEHPSFTRRVNLHITSLALFQQHAFWGIGLNQFTASLDSAPQLRESVRFDQPVHQVFWLLLAEAGLLGLGIAIGILWQAIKNNPQAISVTISLLWVLLPSLTLDHYVATHPTGLLILWFWWLMVVKKPANPVQSQKP